MKRYHLFSICLMHILFIFAVLLGIFPLEKCLAQEEIIETEIGMDQMIVEEGQEFEPVLKTIEDLDLSFDERQIMMINESLKNMVEENKKLADEKESAKKELGSLRGESEVRSNRIGALTRQRDNLRDQIKNLEETQEKFAEKIKELENLLSSKERDYRNKIDMIEQEKIRKEKEKNEALSEILPTLDDSRFMKETKAEQEKLKKQAKKSLKKVQKSASKAAATISRLDRENKQLIKDSARVHYNLGNLMFEQGKYDRALIEYKKVVELMPYDAEAHYNLAFVSGEFLRDQKTALEHYRQYIYLKPDADDVPLVKEKILEAELSVKTRIKSHIDNPKWVE